MGIQTLYDQAAAAQKSGNLAEAERLYREILANAAIPEAMVNYANLLARLGRGGEALIQYDRALQARPDFFEAHFNRANLLLEMKRFEDAAAGFDRAVAARGDVPGAWNNRGTALRSLRRFSEALESYDRAVALAPGHVNALTNRAIALFDLRRLGEALAVADRALAAQPGFAEALYIKGNILRDMGRLPDALAAYEQAHGQPHALNGTAQMALALCDWERTAALAPRLKEATLTGGAVIQPFVLLGYSDDAGLQRRCAENYVRRVAPAQAPLSGGKPYGHDKIRLAYLSADFHQHPTAQLMAELFERHDRNRFEVTAVAFGPDDGSAMRARLARAFDRFEDVRAMSDLDVARLLRAREIDIAVDLNGHTEGARPGIFAHRPAPVQVNYLVYPGTSGASYMTHILADRIVLPPEHQVFYSEKVAYLPDCYQANDATRMAGDAPTRAQAGLPAEGFVFCCFNNGWKITAPVFDIWMRLLAQVDGSVLWLLDGPHAANLRAAAAAHSIDAARFVFAPKTDAAAHLARHRLADLFLDTLPYNAHTTASDALWADVPVITQIGKAFPGRVAASLLKAIDLPELVTANAGAYEALALDLAKNPTALKATREKLARGRTTAPLYDSAKFTREIEAAYTAMLG
ncbi:MAG TPA: tetratricopeptide repeat protein [Rhizomicrobium sp.]|nr:tetratricopeptide repeat protein [Rhizomicrobium sp.]